jgi:transcription elongation factor GreA
VLISQTGEEALRRELAALLEERTEQLPRRLQRAREFGEATGNDEYLQIVEEQAVCNARIQGIRRILASAEVVDPGSEAGGSVTVGSTVTLMLDGRRIVRQVLGAHEPIGEDGVSAASPIGEAIVGRSIGDVVAADLPNGKSVDIEIVAVRPSETADAIAA